MVWFRRHGLRALAVLVLAVLVVAAMDWLSVSLESVVESNSATWWGKQETIPYWENVAPPDGGWSVTTRSLAITIAGERAAAVYTVTAPAKSAFVERLTTDPAAGIGRDLVDNLLGDAGIAEFRYGFTGPQRSYVFFSFHDPQVSVNGSVATVTLTADPVALYFTRQYVEVYTPGGLRVTEKGGDQVHITPATVQDTVIPGGGRLSDTGKSGSEPVANLLRGNGLLQVTVAGSDAGPGWLDGLRAIGGIDVPYADDALFCLANLFVYAVLLWALRERPGAGEELTRTPLAAVARKAVLTVIVGLAAVGFLNFVADLAPHLSGNSADALAGAPVGLLVAGTVVAWPAACCRLGPAPAAGDAASSAGGSARSASPPVIRRAMLAACAVVLHLVVAATFIATVSLMFHVTMRIQVVPVLALAAVVPGLARLLLGRRPVAVPLVSAGLLAGALTTTAAWPLLRWYTADVAGTSMVNVLGKVIFVVAAIAAVAGLTLLCRAVVAELVPGGSWRRRVTVLIATALFLVVVPGAAARAQVFAPHAGGLVPADLFFLFGMITAVLDWLLLGLALAVAARLPATAAGPDPRPLARRLGIAAALPLLYLYGNWLYVPLSLILGLVVFAWKVFPRNLVRDYADPREADEARSDATSALKRAIEGRRHAEFAAGQRDALSASGTEKLRDYLLDNPGQRQENYDRGLAALDGAQESLARLRDRQQQDAGDAACAAFSHYGNLPDVEAARHAAAAGAVLGVIPATVMLLTTPPPSPGSGYALLDFFGGTAWSLLQWPVIGWFVGYYMPLIKGRNGAEKALWLTLAVAGASLPLSIMWDTPYNWANDLINNLNLLAFLIVVCIYACDLRPLKTARLRRSDWAQVHNWRFVVTWSTALVAAIGTAGITFLTVATTDLANSTLISPTGPPSSHGSGTAGGTGASGG